jgi:DNA-binding NtrC family response regulator
MQDVDAVLSDIQMPQMSGIELLAQLRVFNAALPVILMTGYANVVSSDDAKTLGATTYLSKPFDADALLVSLERAVRSKSRQTTVPEHV